MEFKENRIAFILGNITHGAGTERSVINLANNFSDQGMRVKIISLYSSGGGAYYSINSDVEVVHLNLSTENSLIKRLLYYPKFISKFSNVLQDQDIVIGTTHAINCLLPFVKNSKKIQKIGCEHMDYWGTTKSTRALRKLIYPKLDVVVVLTQDDKNQYAKHIPKIKKCAVIPNQYSFYPEKASTLDKKRIIAVGRLEMQKGFDILLDDLHEVISRYPDWEIEIFGDGSMKNILKEKIEEYNLENVTLKKPTKKIEAEFLEASFYLMTSRNEGLPMVLLEAKACGLPIMAYNCPTGPKDLITNGEDGFLIELEDREALRKGYKELIENETLRQKMGQHARKNVLKFSPQNVLEKWINLFTS